MFTFPISRRQDDRPDTRRTLARRPLVEALEGRQLLSTFGGGGVGQHIGMNASVIQGNHIGMNASVIQGNHIG